MRHGLLLVALLSLSSPLLAQSGPPSGGGPGGGMGGPGMGGPGGGPGGRRPPEMKPIKRQAFDEAVTGMFRLGDTNGDGYVTLAELRATIDARRDAVVQARFERIDADRNGAISSAEFLAWQRDMGTAALSDNQAPTRDSEIIPAFIGPDLGEGEQYMALRRLIDPLSATMMVKANVNYDQGLTLEELLAYEGALFDAADKDGDGQIGAGDMRPDGEGGRPGGPGGPAPRGEPERRPVV